MNFSHSLPSILKKHIALRIALSLVALTALVFLFLPLASLVDTRQAHLFRQTSVVGIGGAAEAVPRFCVLSRVVFPESSPVAAQRGFPVDYY